MKNDSEIEINLNDEYNYLLMDLEILRNYLSFLARSEFQLNTARKSF